MPDHVNDALSGLRIAVIGGSYAGLCAGLALRCVGADVDIYERSAQPNRTGGGIVMQPDFADYLEAFGYARPETVAVPTVGRRFLNRDGSIAREVPDATFYTGWDTVLNALRDAFGPNRLHAGRTLASVEGGAEDDGDGVVATFADGTRTEADLLIGADGIGSAVRRQLEPDVVPVYAGYVGYRGLLRESALSDEQLELFRDRFVLYGYPHSHVLCYLIPGEGGTLGAGSRRFNWVWYVSQTPEELRSLLTDLDGVTHRSSLGPGEMADQWADRLRERARADLPSLLAEAVERTESPFVQAIFDMEVSRMVHGRSVLLGDAAFLVRPHTASGASKAAADAIALAHRLGDAGSATTEALEGWELERMAATCQIVHLGRMIAARGGLGS